MDSTPNSFSNNKNKNKEEDEIFRKENSDESHLSENQIEFKIYIFFNRELDKSENILEIDNFYEELIDHVEKLTRNYIWNNERFQMSKPVPVHESSPQSDIVFVSKGTLDFGDNLEDEWFIVSILFKLTQIYSNKLVIKCVDNDGEFLLIQAARHLPKWASSAADNCMNNRVFIYNGSVHIIPPANNPSQVTYLPSAGAIPHSSIGAKIVHDFSHITIAAEAIQKSIQNRIRIFENDQINNLYHRATCLLPSKLVLLLKNNPNLISHAINRFCEKDPNDLKICSRLNVFKPVDLINYRVVFTKHLYGKLKYCDYKPLKSQNWPQMQNTEEQNDARSENQASRDRSLLGLKLTCAFEIISSSLVNSNTESGVEKSNNTYDLYLDRLKNLGYFKGYLENSKGYNELLEKAKEGYFGVKEEKVEETPGASASKTNDYNKLFESIYLDKPVDKLDQDYVIKLKEEINDLNKQQENETDDSDDWLCVEAPQLDDYLEMYSRGEVNSTYDFRLIANTFKKFMKAPKADVLDGVDYKPIDYDNADEQLIDFDIDKIESNLKELLDFKNKSKKNINNDDDEEDEDDDDDETDSFYEIDDDMLDENKSGDKNKNSSLKDLMNQMDRELRSEQSLSRLNQDENDRDRDELDLDINLVTNALESYSSQLGLTGPVSNILKSFGL